MNAINLAEQNDNRDLLTQMTAEVVSAYVGGNAVQSSDLPTLIADVHAALSKLSSASSMAEAEKPEPAVNPKRSVTREYIICLEDGKKFKSLKRHLMSHYGMTPEEYREKWGLRPDYPMVAPEYAERRSQLARDMGLGRRPDQKASKRRK